MVTAVAGVLASVTALLNPAADLLVPPTPVVAAGLGTAAPLLGARLAATRSLRSALFGPEGHRRADDFADRPGSN